MEMRNTTPFVAERIVHVDATCREILVVIVKATFRYLGGKLTPADKQVPLQLADSFYGEPGKSSVEYESDLAPFKPGTDIVVLGHAYPPGRRDTEVHVSVRAGPVRATIAVLGHRTWARPTSPAPFDKMPLVYERAFGGRDESADAPEDHEVERRNPVGVGFRARRSRMDLTLSAMPNLEDPKQRLKAPGDRPEPVGLGFIGRHWHPRAELAGTAPPPGEKAPPPPSPFLPPSFDDRYHQGAHPRLVVTPYLRGGDPVELVHVSPFGPIHFTPPDRPPRATVVLGTERRPLELCLDTLLVEPDHDRAVLVYRGRMPLGRDLFRARRVEVESP